jgi:hypothetical protein
MSLFAKFYTYGILIASFSLLVIEHLLLVQRGRESGVESDEYFIPIRSNHDTRLLPDERNAATTTINLEEEDSSSSNSKENSTTTATNHGLHSSTTHHHETRGLHLRHKVTTASSSNVTSSEYSRVERINHWTSSSSSSSLKKELETGGRTKEGGPVFFSSSTPQKQQQQQSCFPGGQLDELSYAVIQKIRTGIIHNQKLLASIPSNVPRPKILCMVYTHEGAHDTKLKAIVDTWAKDCDGFFAASNVTDTSLGAIKLQFDGPESYENMWRKVQAMWIYAYHHYRNDYDYFHICGDDVYVVADNLRMFAMGEHVRKLSNGYLDTFSVMSKNRKKWSKAKPRALVFGYPILISTQKRNHQYAAGGSGYTLNREALRVFYNLITKFPDNRADSREDVLVARWLELEGITVCDTRDDTGAFRYMPNNPILEYPCLHKWPLKNLDSQVKCNPGLDAFSNETIAIHLNYEKGRRLSKIINYTEDIIYRYDYLLTGGGGGGGGGGSGRRHNIVQPHIHQQQQQQEQEDEKEGEGCDPYLLSYKPNITRMELLHLSQRKAFRIHQLEELKAMLRNSDRGNIFKF